MTPEPKGHWAERYTKDVILLCEETRAVGDGTGMDVARPCICDRLTAMKGDARAAALEEAAHAVRVVNEAADVPGGNNPRVRSWALECAEIQIRKLKEGPQARAQRPHAHPGIPEDCYCTKENS